MKSILIYDLETNSTDVDKATPVLMGAYSSKGDDFIWTTNIMEMIQLINSHDIIVGYNSEEYDNKIMENFGCSFYGKINIDLMKIIHGKGFGNDLGRRNVLISPSGDRLIETLHSKSLDATTKALEGPLKIAEFDYNLFKQPFATLTDAQQKLAIEYLKADLDATKYIYEYLEKFFKTFKEDGLTIDDEYRPFMREEWIERKKYLTLSVGSLVYHCVCNVAGLEPKFADQTESLPYEGGFVRMPMKAEETGELYCLDYTSAYPFAYMMGNLFAKADEGWQGTGICETIGTYDDKVYHPLTKTIRQLFNTRYALKKEKNPKEYTFKIIINTLYGITGNPVFQSVHDYTAASDCTKLVRQWIKAASDLFDSRGYTVLYGDTDSIYIKDPFQDKEAMLGIVAQHIAEIKELMNFPQEDFDMSIDDEIRYMAFFKSRGGGFLKKNYLYVTQAGKLKIKGLPIIKSTATELGKKVFKEHIEPLIVNQNTHKVSKRDLDHWVGDALKEDLGLASVFYKVRDPIEYSSHTSLPYKISTSPHYGPGQWNMLKLRREHEKGAGTGRNYVSVDNAKDIRISMIDLSKTESELEHFEKNLQKELTGFI
jgi:DNA polymerase elongation subunit (family B)